MNKGINKVYDMVIELKKHFIQETDESTSLYNYGVYSNVIEYWAETIKDIHPKYLEMIKPIEINQYNNFVLLRYGNYSDVFGGKYDYMEFWDDWDGLYRHCRSIVIDIYNDEVVILPFDKFFNMNEREETSQSIVKDLMFDGHNRVEITNKLDGSMQCARYYRDEIVMSGSQSIDPSNSWRLKDGYSMLTDNYKDMIKSHPKFTFIFEYISKEDAHVVCYDESMYGLHLIGMRNVETGQLVNRNTLESIANAFDIKIAERHFIGFDTMLQTLKMYKSSDKEGYVLRIEKYDGEELIVKVKCDDYVAMHGILSALSSHNLVIRNIGDGTFDDFFAKVPANYKERVIGVANKVFKYNTCMKNDVSGWCQILDSYKYDNLKDKMIYISDYVPKYIQGYVREYAKTGKICTNYIKKRNLNSYIKLNEIESYLDQEN